MNCDVCDNKPCEIWHVQRRPSDVNELICTFAACRECYPSGITPKEKVIELLTPKSGSADVDNETLDWLESDEGIQALAKIRIFFVSVR